MGGDNCKYIPTKSFMQVKLSSLNTQTSGSSSSGLLGQSSVCLLTFLREIPLCALGPLMLSKQYA